MAGSIEACLEVYLAGYQVHDQASVWDRGIPLSDYDLVVVLAGSAKFEWGEGSAVLRAGDCILCRKGRHYVQRVDADELMTEVYIHFDWTGGAAPSGWERSLPHVLHGMEDPTLLRALVLRVVEAHHRQKDRGTASDWLKAVLLELKRQHAAGEPQGPLRDREAAIQRISMEVLEKVAHPWRVEEMARKAGMSPDHFRRLFRRFNGLSAGEFILRSRMEAARRHLRQSSMSVGEIAEQLGFCDLSAFSRLFKKRTGYSPLAYRSRKAVPNRGKDG